MPNHIQNRLTVIGEKQDVLAVFDSIKGQIQDGEPMKIDFNAIIEMPDELSCESSLLGDMGLAAIHGIKEDFYTLTHSFERFHALDDERKKTATDLANTYKSNLEKYGHKTWYDWCVKNWGTKWNAYEQNDSRDTENTIHFKTAWSAPCELMRILSGRFPKVEIQFDYADEDSGSNCGRIKFKNGSIVEMDKPKRQSNEAYEIYFDLHPNDKQNYEFIGGEWQYKDDE